MTNNKKLNLLLSIFAMVVMIFSKNIVAKAQELNGPIINSINISKNVVGINSECNISMQASIQGGNLGNNATISYVFDGEHIGVPLTLVNGKYEGKFVINDEVIEGNWKIDFVVLEDTNQNAYSVPNSNIYIEGQDLSAYGITVVNKDIDGPTLKSISVDKKTIGKREDILLTVEAQDNYSELVEEAKVCYTFGTGKDMIEKELKLSLNGTKYTGVIETNENTVAGLYQVKTITLKDKSGNEVILNGTEQDLSGGNYTLSEKLGPSPIKIELKTKDVKGQQSNATIQVTNNSVIDRKVTIVAALYDKDQKLINYGTITRVIKTGQSTEVSGILKILPNGHVVKCMVWDSKDTMNCLSDVIEIPVK